MTVSPGLSEANRGDELKQPDELLRENQKLRERLTLSSQASLHITESLDFDTVLQEVVDGARVLTASRYGAITVSNEAGGPPEFIVSGLSREEHQGLWDMPEGQGIFEFLSDLESPCGSRTSTAT